MASSDLVLGIDASTTAVKAIAFDETGTPQAQARATYPLHTPAPGFFEQDAEDWWTAFQDAVSTVCSGIGGDRVRALAIGVQRETFVPLATDGQPTHRAILWLDERARAEVAELGAEIGADRIHEITGKPPDPTPSLYAMAWLKKHRPDALSNAAMVVDVHGYLVHKLTGQWTTSLPAADPLGIVDVKAGAFDADLVAAAGLRLDQLPGLVPGGEKIGSLLPDHARALGLRDDVLVIAGAGDGQVTGLGLGAIGGDNAYLSIGSGIVTGMLSDSYRIDRAFRTLASSIGDGFMLETVIRSGMQFVDWVVNTTGQSIEALEDAALEIDPGSDGLLAVPYFAGVMNPYWDPAARGTFTGLSLAHTSGHLFRAVLEGLALEQAVATEAMEKSVGRRAQRFVACGGGLKSRILPKVMAATLKRPIAASPVEEGVALGAAILAARGAGWFDGVGPAIEAMVTPPDRIHAPDPALTAIYEPLVTIYRDLHPSVAPLQARLSARDTGVY